MQVMSRTLGVGLNHRVNGSECCTDVGVWTNCRFSAETSGGFGTASFPVHRMVRTTCQAQTWLGHAPFVRYLGHLHLQ